jgi:Uncharacterized conserved protein
MAKASTSAPNGSKPAADIDALSAQIDQLRDDLSKMVSIVGSMGVQAKDDAKETVTDRIDDLAAQANRVKDEAQFRAELFKETAQDKVREQPATALLIATGIGFLVGAFLSKR